MRRLTYVSWTTPDSRINYSAVITGLGWAIAVTFFLAVILGLWITVSGQLMYYLSGTFLACMLAGAGTGGIFAGFRASRQGWLHGGLAGLVYGALFTVLLGGGAPEVLLNPAVWLRLMLLAATGMLAGIAGVNLPLKKTSFSRRAAR